MPHSKASAVRIRAAERRSEALRLRKGGTTYAQIGRELGVSEQRAHRIVTQELARLNAERAEQAAEVTRLELERLDVLLAGVWAKAQAGDGPAIDRVLSIMGRRAKLLGIDAPEKRELAGAGGGALRFCLEEAVAADRELEEWQRERQQPGGDVELPPGSPQVP
jgi:hypothetical protein